MRALTFAAIGAGHRSTIYAKFFLDNPHFGTVVAVADPDPARRARFADAHQIEPGRAYARWEDLLDQPKFCDALIIGTPDRLHLEPALRAMELGYDLLLEKPISPDPRECVTLAQRAEALGRTVVVCHVLRYTPYYEALKQLVDEGVIGRLHSVQWFENVGFWHMAHAFVRGNWRNSQESSPMILAKCCHDMDMLQWLIGGRCLRVQSFGALSHFRPEHAPPGATLRCTDGCKAEAECPYSALKIYLGPDRPALNLSAVSLDFSDEAVYRALQTGPYGRCVYHCDNDVVDHQTVNLEFEGDVTVAFTMTGFTMDNARSFKLMGTRGEIRGYDSRLQLEVRTFDGRTRLIEVQRPAGGHLGGDSSMVRYFVVLLNGHRQDGRSSIWDSARSHLIAFAAEESRLNGGVVNMAEYEQRYMGQMNPAE